MEGPVGQGLLPAWLLATFRRSINSSLFVIPVACEGAKHADWTKLSLYFGDLSSCSQV